MPSQEEILQDLQKDVAPYTYAVIAYFAEHSKAVERPQEMPQAEDAGTREILEAMIAWTATWQMEVISKVEQAGGTEFEKDMASLVILSTMLPVLQRVMDAL